ncbi:MAG TPA: hypothetical protein VFU71_07575 [Burkholderiaceae bacterium]|nr:hypothetical protein [Burkholderiaceae bacterium]
MPALVRYRSKTVAAWLAVLAGSLGAQRFYLHGSRDVVGWLHPPPTLLGLWGAWRMYTLGQDDRLAWLLVPVLGLMLSIAMLCAIIVALTPDAAWDARYNPGQPVQQTRWGPILGAVAALLIGGIVLMGTIAFAGQRFFEWQQQGALDRALTAG